MKLTADQQAIVERINVVLRAALLPLAALIAAWALVWLGWETLVHALRFDGEFSNGPFQLYNVLRRVADGQVYGRDFQAFTGIGTNWAHLPVYVLAGGDLRASEISRYLTSGLAHGAAAVALACAFAPMWQTRRQAILFGLLFFAGGAVLFLRVFQPQVSLLGMRTLFPLMIAAALALPRPAPWIAVALAAALLSSVDHALASLVALASAVAVAFALEATRDRRRPIVVGAVAGLGLFLAILLAATAGNLAAPLRYGLIDVPGDQFWYFGVPPNEFLPLNWRILLEDRGFARFGIIYAGGAAALVYLWRRWPALAPSFAFLFVYATLGMTSQLGYIGPVNLHGSERALFALILAALLTGEAWRTYPAVAVLVGLYVGSGAFKHLRPSPMPEGGGYLSEAWRGHLAAVDRNAGAGPIWSVYAGLPEAQRGTFHPASDYLIHALGPDLRARYVDRFLQTKPALVRLDPPRWPFAPWFLLENWPFYREVFRAYAPVYSDKLGSLWRPDVAAKPAPQPPVAASIDGQGCARLAPSRTDTVYSVDVDYTVSNPLRFLPVLGATPRLLLEVTGTSDPSLALVSVPGGPRYGGHFVFPVAARAGDPVMICPRVSSLLPGVALTLAKVEATREELSAPVVGYIFSVGR